MHRYIAIFIACAFIIISTGVFELSKSDQSVYWLALAAIIVSGYCAFSQTSFTILYYFTAFVFLFLLQIPIFKLAGLYSFPPDNMILWTASIREPIPDSVIHQSIFYVCLGTVSFSIGALLSQASAEYSSFIPELESQKKKYKILLLLSIVLFPFVVGFQIQTFFDAVRDGYVTAIHVNSSRLGSNVFLKVAETLYYVFVILMVRYSYTKRRFFTTAALFLIPAMIQLASGYRGAFVIGVVVLLFYYSQLFGNPKFRNIALFGGVLVLAAVAAAVFRYEGEISISALNVLQLIIVVVVETSSSLSVVAYSIVHHDEFFNTVPFIFGYPAAVFDFTQNYSYEGLLSKSYLSQHLTYLLSPSKLFGGSTVGGSTFAEVYLFTSGQYFLFVLTFLFLGFISQLIINFSVSSDYAFLIGFELVQSVFMSPRGSIMNFFDKELVISVLVIFLLHLVLRVRGVSRTPV